VLVEIPENSTSPIKIVVRCGGDGHQVFELDALSSLNGVMVPSLYGGSRFNASKTLIRKDSSAYAFIDPGVVTGWASVKTARR